MIITGRDEEQSQIYEAGGFTYICSARVGTPLTEPKWTIYRVDVNGNKLYAVSKKTGLPTVNYEFIPSEYATLEYSDDIYKVKPTVTFTINSGDLTTTSRDVVIDLTVTSYTNITGYRISESDKLDLEFVSQEPTTFTLSEGIGNKTIYVRVKDNAGNYSDVASATIELV